MANRTSPSGGKSECSVAEEAVFDVMSDHCSSEEEVRRLLGERLGVEPDENCDAALDEGLNGETCGDFKGLRQWVLCRAHDILDNHDVSFGEALNQAWGEADEQCDTI